MFFTSFAVITHVLLAPGEFQTPTVSDVSQLPYPRIAATAIELQRLRAALDGEDQAAMSIVADRIRAADAAMRRSLTFPPRGGQHNQWYQCDDCQLALKTVDATHHQCAKCKKEYSGEPYDDVVYSRVHGRNLQAMFAAAWAHALTGEEKYAKFAGRVLLGYADRYRDYPYHSAGRGTSSWDKKAGGHLFEQTLNEASVMANAIAPAYDLTRASGVLSPEQDTAIRNGLLRPMLQNIGKNRSGKSNWQTWHNAAMIAGGGVLGEKAWIERAIADPGNGFVDQMKVSVSDEGMWYENSWGYHFYTLGAMIHIADYARRLDIDLWSHPRLHSMFSVAFDYAMPDGRLPRFGDDVNTSLTSATRSLEFSHHAYRPQASSPYLSKSVTWDSIMLGRKLDTRRIAEVPRSRVFPSAGHAIARTGGQKGLASVITFGPYGGFHGHYDKLSFVFYGRGTELGVDPGRARSQAYRLPIHKYWYKATLAHNAVVVDRKSQAPAAGELLLFDVSPSRAAVVARCTEAYDGVEHTRLVLQTADYLLVFDDLQADANRRFDWFYHNRGRLAECEFANETTTSDGDYLGMDYVQNPRVAATDDAPRATFKTNNVRTVLTLDAAANTGILVGDGVGSSVLDRVPLIRVTRHGKSVRFAAILEPVSDDVLPTVQSVAWSEKDGSILIHIGRNDRHDRAEVDADWKTVTFNSK